MSFECQFLFLLNPLRLVQYSWSQERQISLHAFVPDTLGYIFSIVPLGNHCRCAIPATVNGSVNLIPHVHQGNLGRRYLCFLKHFSSLEVEAVNPFLCTQPGEPLRHTVYIRWKVEGKRIKNIISNMSEFLSIFTYPSL